MGLINTIKEKYLLEQSTESLYQECKTWQETIALWETEIDFYTKFIETKLYHNVKQDDKDRISRLFEEIVEIDLDDLKEKTREHEKGLINELNGTNGTVDHRAKHWNLAQQFSTLQDHMKFLKYAIFELFKLAKLNPFNEGDTLHTIYERRAVRKFKKDPISKNQIEQIIEAGRMAPSALNRQPWKFYVITDPKKIKRYSEEIVKVSSRILHFFIRKFNDEEDSIFHSAPAVIFITAKKNNEWASLDVGMCAQNIMLAAKTFGLDTCPVGLAKSIENAEVYNELNIPSDEEIKLAIVLGYGNETPKIHERKTDNLKFLD